MPRRARELSRSDIYHVMIRGINRQRIFEEDEDYLYFTKLLAACKKQSGFQLFAFCLMPNHVHFLIKVCDEPLELIFKRIGSRYVHWYNEKYERVGHLFQDRFKSEKVEDDRYFIAVLRYIIQNPMKAGMEKEPGSWRWSSFRAYQEGSGTITDTKMALEMAGSRKSLVDFLKASNNDQAMEIDEPSKHISDEEAMEIMVSVSKCGSASDFQDKLSLSEQKAVIAEMFRQGASIKQITCLTGKARSTVYKIQATIKPEA